jgi:hypothetical protein
MKLKKQKRASRNVSRRAHIEKLKAGDNVWNEWSAALRAQDPDWRPDLRDANLAGLQLFGADLRRAILSGANLKGADLTYCDLRAAKFRGAGLEGATLNSVDLRYANFDRANLTGVSLRNAKLRGARFLETRVDGASFSEARIGNTYFVDVKLDGASDLAKVNHYGPSHLSLGTLTQSGGLLPLSFLRGCGVAPLVQVMLGGDRTERVRALDEIQASGFPVELPQRYVMHLSHGWRARIIHRELNQRTEFSWNLFNLANVENEPGPLHRALRGLKKNSTVILLVNPNRHEIHPERRTIIKHLEKARRRRQLKIVLLSVWGNLVNRLVTHRSIDIPFQMRNGLAEESISKIVPLLA